MASPVRIPNTIPPLAFDGQTIIAPQGVVQVGEVPLSALDQGGATTGQVLRWSGTAWAPATHPQSTTVDVSLSTSSGSATVTGLTWVTASTIFCATIVDHPSGVSAQDAADNHAVVAIGSVVAGVGFTVYMKASASGTGPYRIHVIAV